MSDLLSELQSENQTLREQLDVLNQKAMENELLMRQTQNRQLEFLTAESLPDLLRILLVRLRDVYQLQAVSLVFEDKEKNISDLLDRHHLTLKDYQNLTVVENLKDYSAQLKLKNSPFLGAFNSNYSTLFLSADGIQDNRISELKSIAILPLSRHSKKIGYLNFGSDDPNRFSGYMGTEFLEQLSTIVSFCLENVINRERLVLTGLTDVLTGWPNRRYLQQRLQEELARVQRKQAPISCIMFDLDNFKHINDTFGHPAGDEVLRVLSHRLRSTLRYGDIAARYGGEEFVLALPDVKLPEAVNFAERIREIVENSSVELDDGRHIKVTISLGVACMNPDWSAKSMTYLMGELIAQADRHLYFAKSNGRNQVAY